MSLAEQIKKTVADTLQKQAEVKAEEERKTKAQRAALQQDFSCDEEVLHKEFNSLRNLTIKGEHLGVYGSRFDYAGFSLPRWDICLGSRCLASVSLTMLTRSHTSGRRYDDGHYDEEWYTTHAGSEIRWEKSTHASNYYITDHAIKALSEFLIARVMEEGE